MLPITIIACKILQPMKELLEAMADAAGIEEREKTLADAVAASSIPQLLQCPFQHTIIFFGLKPQTEQCDSFACADAVSHCRPRGMQKVLHTWRWLLHMQVHKFRHL